MDPDFSLLNDFLERTDADGYLIEANSENADQRYMSGFDAPDPFITLYDGEDIHLLLPGMECRRADRESRARTVTRNETYGVEGRIRIYGAERNRGVLAGFLHAHGIESVAVPYWFPAATVEGLRKEGVTVRFDTEGVLLSMRARKRSDEIEFIRECQRANEAAMATVERLLTEATVVENVLHLNGEVLTSERVRTEIERELLRHDCSHQHQEPVIACGSAAADPHDRGSGPLYAGETILVDIFPKNTASQYFSDISRTFVKGEPHPKIKRWSELVVDAQQAALDQIEPGVSAPSIHDAACEVFEEAGFETKRTNPRTDVGFTHRTGHGLGLSIHEDPRIGPKGDTIQPGNVFTVEPGLYDPDVGGVRIEDLVVVTEDGYENLTEYPVELVL